MGMRGGLTETENVRVFMGTFLITYLDGDDGLIGARSSSRLGVLLH